MLTPLLWSLSLAIAISFLLPLIFVGSLFGLLMLLSVVPALQFTAHVLIEHLCQILAVFGEGLPLQGLLTISLTLAFVGGLFDLFNFSRSYFHKPIS